jgi:hypothetical protein
MAMGKAMMSYIVIVMSKSKSNASVTRQRRLRNITHAKGNAMKEIILKRWVEGRIPQRVIMHGSNRLFAGRTNVGKWRFFAVATLLRIEALAAALIIGVYELLYLDTIQAIKPPIERDAVHKQSRAAL